MSAHADDPLEAKRRAELEDFGPDGNYYVEPEAFCHVWWWVIGTEPGVTFVDIEATVDECNPAGIHPQAIWASDDSVCEVVR